MTTPIAPCGNIINRKLQSDDIRPTLSPNFLELYPGPFAYRPGTDWVDSTFDIMCTSSGQQLASVYYWEERLTSELIARVVAESLNALLPATQDDSLTEWKPVSKWEVAAFHGMHPGPYRAGKTQCDIRGPGCEVLCHGSGESVLQVYNYGTAHAQLISTEVAAALNALKPRT